MKNIPKICHLYWNKEPMAWLNFLTVASFRRYNPDWEIIVYITKQTPDKQGKNIHTPDYTGANYFNYIEPYVNDIKEIDMDDWGINKDIHACSGSDIFRRNILYNYGGVYSDFDTIWLKPIEAIKDVNVVYGNPRDFESLVCFYEGDKGFHNVSNLISEPMSPYLASLIEEQEKIKPPYQHQSYGSSMLNNKYPTLESIISKFPRILAIPYITFYPYNTYFMETLFEEPDISVINNKNVMCIHWFYGNEITKRYLNDGDYYKQCAMNTILKKEGYI